MSSLLSRIAERIRGWFHRTPLPVAVAEVPKKLEAFGPPAPVSGIGNARNISDLLNRLPEYFKALRALRKVDEDAYDVFSRIGGCFPTETSRFDTKVPRHIVQSPPMIRCLFMPNHREKGEKEDTLGPIIYMMRLAGGQVCVGRDGDMVNLPQGLCYRVMMVFHHDKMVGHDTFFVNIDEEGVVHLLPERRIVYQNLPKGGGFFRPASSRSRFLVAMAAERGETVEQHVTLIAAVTLSSERPKSAILVRATQGSMVAAWTIDKRDGKRFFAKRDTDLATDGKRKRILHYVGEFSRQVGDAVQEVREHYRGERSFTWNDYSIEISGLGFHHRDVFDADISLYESETATNRKTASLDVLAKKMSAHYSRPMTLSNRAKRRPRTERTNP